MSQANEKPRRGDRIKLVSTDDPYTELKPGDEGTVEDRGPAGDVMVQWDSGSRLSLLDGIDRWEITGVRIVTKAPEAGR